MQIIRIRRCFLASLSARRRRRAFLARGKRSPTTDRRRRHDPAREVP